MEAANGGSVQGSHALREKGGTLIEDVQLRGSKRAGEQSLGMREFV